MKIDGMKRGMAITVVVGALTLLGAAEVGGQTARARVEEGNRLYEEERFGEAHRKYLEALAEDPASAIIPFNDGNALYQDTDYRRAMEAYRQAIEAGDPSLASSAWYNLGNALYRQQQMRPSLDAYKQSLRLNPADVDAKHNLERALQQLQEQQQQENDQNQDREQEDQEQDQQPPDENQQQGHRQDDETDEAEDPQERPPDQGDEPSQDVPAAERVQSGQMTPEAAVRLLDAIDENPEDVNRKPASATGRRPRKPW